MTVEELEDEMKNSLKSACNRMSIKALGMVINFIEEDVRKIFTKDEVITILKQFQSMMWEADNAIKESTT